MPACPLVGFVGESKTDIDPLLPDPWTLRLRSIGPGCIDDRLAIVAEAAQAFGWPLIIKPDAGQRGVGLRKVQSLEQAREILTSTDDTLVAQQYHPGPYEAGVMVMRMPGSDQVRVFSITDKIFPELHGDGHHTILQLIRLHPRFCMQEAVFSARLW